eukprot:5824790-Alexandrium_andersonii.AAC.1
MAMTMAVTTAWSRHAGMNFLLTSIASRGTRGQLQKSAAGGRARCTSGASLRGGSTKRGLPTRARM